LIKYLVSGKSGDHLPFTDSSGNADHRLMGAAWAALHGGYRGKQYAGPNKQSAIEKLTSIYKKEKMATPSESWDARGVSIMHEADGSLRAADSFDSIRCAVSKAIDDAINAGEDMDLDGDNDAYCCCWIVDMYPSIAIYSMDGNLFRIQYHVNADGSVILGTPYPVERSYTDLATPPAEDDATEAASRVLVIGTQQLELKESYNAEKGVMRVRVIQPGFNKSKSRFYPAEVLKRDFKIFEGAKMFADHQTEKESDQRPEGSVHNWVANLQNVFAEDDGNVYGDSILIDPAFKAKMAELNKQNLLGEMGVSIRAIGEATDATEEGTDHEYKQVNALLASRSVDFVTYAGAGGQVEAMESDANADDVDLVSEAELRSRRPDLVSLIESKAQRSAKNDMKTVEEQLKEANETIATQKAALAESAKKQNQAVAAVALSKLLGESKLPEVAKKRLQAQFANAESDAGMKEAIEGESAYLKSLHVVAKNNGSAENGSEDATEEADDTKRPTKEQMAEAFQCILPDDQAKVAAGFLR
jgi:hypothetical protein